MERAALPRGRSNRRDIWAGSDLVGLGKMRSDWNLRLLEEVRPALLSTVLTHCPAFCMH